jgi:hypothetical protein
MESIKYLNLIIIFILLGIFALSYAQTESENKGELEIGTLPDEWKPRTDLSWFKNLWTTGTAISDPDDRTKIIAKPGGDHLINTGDGGVGIYTTEKYGDVHIDLEVMIPVNGNSGILLMGQYEVQVWDSYGKPVLWANQWMGTIVATKEPDAHPEKPGGEWQHFIIDFRAPRFDKDGNKIKNALFEQVILNGVMVQENVEAPAPTPVNMPGGECEKGPLLLSGFTGQCAYRNIKIEPLQEKK